MRIGRCKWYDDEDGRCVDVRVDAKDGTWVVVSLQREHGEGSSPIKGRGDDHTDSDEAFERRR